MILQLNNVRRMRVKTGQKTKDLMDLNVTGKDVLDSSHYIGAKRIEQWILDRIARKKKLFGLRLQRLAGTLGNS